MNNNKNCNDCEALQVLKEIRENNLKIKELKKQQVKFMKSKQFKLDLIFPN